MLLLLAYYWLEFQIFISHVEVEKISDLLITDINVKPEI